MKRGLAVLFVLGGLIAAGWWWRSTSSPTSSGGTPKTRPSTSRVTDWATQPLAPQGVKKLEGVVRSRGQPVSGATVWALGPVPGEAFFTDVPCRARHRLAHPALGCAIEDPRLWLETLEPRFGEAMPLGRAQTDAQGAFSLEGLGDAPVLVFVEAGDRFALQPDAHAGTPLELTVTPGEVLQGEVVLEDGKLSREGLTIVAALPGLPRYYETKTDARGRYRLGPVPAGDWRVFSRLGDELAQSSDTEVGARLYFSRVVPLSGTVRDAQGPLAGLEVEVNEFLVTSGADGRFSFPALLPSSVHLRARRGELMGELTARLPTTDELVLLLDEGVLLRGQVVDERGRAVEGASVMSLGEESTPTLTSRDGRFELRRPRTDALEDMLWAQAPGHLASDTVTVKLSQQAPVVLTVHSGVEVSGMVVDDDGAPVNDVQVAVSPAGDYDPELEREEQPRGQTADTDGGFFSVTVTPGPMEVSVNTPQYLSVNQRVTAPATGLRLVLSRGTRVMGQVLDAQGAPLAGASVDVRSGQSSARADTDEDGRFSMTGLLPGPGTALVLVHHEADSWAFEEPLTVPPSGTLELTLRQRQAAVFSGVVKDQTGAPLEAEMTLTTEGLMFATRSDEKGAFRFEHLPEGSMQLIVYSQQAEPLREEVKVPAEGVTLTLSRTPMMRGRVVSSTGAPLKGLHVDLNEITSDDGRFEVPALEVGRVVFEADGCASRWLKTPPVVNGVADFGDVVLTPGREVRVRVVDAETHEPVPEARLSVDETQAQWADTHGGVFKVVLAEPRHARIEARGYRTREETIGAQDVVEVALTRGLTVTVRVIDATGRALRGVNVEAFDGHQQLDLDVAPGPVFRGSGFTPGKWALRVGGRGQLFETPVVEVSESATSFELHPRQGGATVDLQPDTEVDTLVLLEGDHRGQALDALMSTLVVLMWNRAPIEHVPPGQWTVVALKRTQDHSTLASFELLDVPESGTQRVPVHPEWKPLVVPQQE